METLDLRKFAWTRQHKNYVILAIAEFQDQDVVVYKDNNHPYEIAIMTVDSFCREFQATYELNG